MQSLDSDTVGQSGGDFFKPDSNQQRIAMIPYLIAKSELEIPEELKKKALGGDTIAQEELEDIASLKEDIIDGLKSKPGAAPRTREFGEGYLFPRLDSHMVHYLDKEKTTFFCKADEYRRLGREPVCCNECAKDPKDRGAYKSYGTIVLVYETISAPDSCEVIEVPPERQKSLPDGTKLNFRFSLKYFGLTDGKVKAWKQFSKNFPLITSDFDVWKEKKGNAEILKFSPCQGNALWFSLGTSLQEKVIKEAKKMWDSEEGVTKAMGRNFSIEEIDKMFGIRTQNRPSSGTEGNFDSLLK